MQNAQKSWMRLRGFHHLNKVIKGIKFTNGKVETKENNLFTDAGVAA